LCFGTTRAGTTFLHKYLRLHPRVWLPPQKELHYFSFQRSRGFGNRKHLKHLKKIVPSMMQAVRGKRGPASELGWQMRYLFGSRSDRWYERLYDVPPPLVTGMIEPTYAVIEADQIRSLHDLMPDVRLIYMMRDPIERAWSSVTKSCAKNKNRRMSEVTDAEMYEKLDRSAIRMSCYADHLARWEAIYRGREILFGFFEEIENEPATFVERVCRFLDIQPLDEAVLADAAEPVNDTRKFKTEIPLHIERYMAERLAASTRVLHERFGGHATSWHQRIQAVLAADGERRRSA